MKPAQLSLTELAPPAAALACGGCRERRKKEDGVPAAASSVIIAAALIFNSDRWLPPPPLLRSPFVFVRSLDGGRQEARGTQQALRLLLQKTLAHKCGVSP